jgi:hypothetical protein
MDIRNLKYYLLLLSCIICIEEAKPLQDNMQVSNSISDLIYRETYQFHFRKVDSLIIINDPSSKNDLSYNLAIVNYYWWRLISGEQNSKYSELVRKRISSIENQYSLRKTQIDEEKLFMLISIFAYNARVSLINNSYFSALSNISKYYSYLKMSFGQEPQYCPFFLTSGLYFFFAGYARVEVPVLTPVLDLYTPGNMDIGLKFLRKAESLSDWKISQEARYFLMKINFDVNHDYKESDRYCNMLLNAYPENLLFQYYKFKILLNSQELEKANKRIVIMEKYALMNKYLTIDEKNYYVKIAKDEFAKSKVKH